MTYLHSTLAEELVSRSEWDLDDSTELGEFFGSIGLDIRDTFKVGYALLARFSFGRIGGGKNVVLTDQHFYNLFPCCESLNEDIRGFKLMRGSVFLDLEEC